MSLSQNNIRNFCIIAHIDHGKSTLADRLLEITGTIEKRKMKEQYLDMHPLERERGITIKLQPVRMNYHLDPANYQLNLIDTPGHVDFTYEVSRSLAAVEGAILLVDVTQGIQAQTLANLYLAKEQNLVIVPVINKIDLVPSSDRIENVSNDLTKLLDIQKKEIILSSAKTGEGVEKILEAIISKIPAPATNINAPLKALIFDSQFDEYKGVIAYVRIIEGQIKAGDKIIMMSSRVTSEVLEVGIFKPELTITPSLSSGEIGYLKTGLKVLSLVKIGDTISHLETQDQVQSLSGYKEIKPMVFAGLYLKEGNEVKRLKEALWKLKLNDDSLSFEPEHSSVFGYGFRGGFLGLLHLEIVQERLKREYGVKVITTVPSVAYELCLKDNQTRIIKSPLELPDPSQISLIKEPWVKLDIISPQEYLGAIMQLALKRRGLYLTTEYLDSQRIILHYEIPLATILVDFYDKLKSISKGYASLNYEFLDYRPVEIVKLNILVAGELVEPLTTLVYKDEVYRVGRHIVEVLKKTLPRQLFEVKIQASLGGKIIAADRLPPLRKDVTAKLYGGDVTRKMKLLEKQKRGKKRMKTIGRIDIPPKVFLEMFKSP